MFLDMPGSNFIEMSDGKQKFSLQLTKGYSSAAATIAVFCVAHFIVAGTASRGTRIRR